LIIAKTSHVLYLKGVQLDIGVAMGQALDQALDRLLRPVRVGGYPVTDVNDGAPILRCEVLIGGFVYQIAKSLRQWQVVES
jgi:hypothetical protein